MKNTKRIIAVFVLTLVLLSSVTSVSASAAWTQSLSEYYNFSYENYMDYLYSHENDNYYLTTPYYGGDWRSPNGDTSYNGVPGMNCSGFVWHILKSCVVRSGGNPSDYQIFSIANPRGWYGILSENSIRYYMFDNKYEALKSGVMSKGDIIIMFCNAGLRPNGQNHIGIYWGDGRSDWFWHCSGDYNIMSEICSGGAVVKFVVVKVCPGTGTLTVGHTDENSKSISGGEFDIYMKSGNHLYTTVKSGESINLPYGTYDIVQKTIPNGYKSDLNNKQTVTISYSNKNSAASFTNEKKLGASFAEAKIKRYIPSVSKYVESAFAEIVFDVYSDYKCENKVGSAVTDSDGRAYFGISDGKYTLADSSTYYFRLSKDNAEKFKNMTFDYKTVFSAVIKDSQITPAVSPQKKYAEVSLDGAVKTVSAPGDKFDIFTDGLLKNKCITPCSDKNGNTSYDTNTAFADEKGYSFFGLDPKFEGVDGYRLSDGMYFISFPDGETAYLNIKSGCVTDGNTGKYTIETKKGDFNLNGIVNISDAREMLRASAKLCGEIFAEQLSAGDFDSDSRITVEEARKLLRFCAKLDNEL